MGTLMLVFGYLFLLGVILLAFRFFYWICTDKDFPPVIRLGFFFVGVGLAGAIAVAMYKVFG